LPAADPFQEHTDETLWAALEKVGLAPIIRQMDGQLEVRVPDFIRVCMLSAA
jgi:hypothetical protein